MAGGVTASKQCSSMLIQKDPDDHIIEAGDGSTTSTSFVTIATLNFTPLASKDFLIFASAGIGVSDLARQATVQLLDNNTAVAYSSKTIYNTDIDDYSPWHCMFKLSALSAAQTFYLQIKAESLNTAKYTAPRIFALNLSAFPAHYYAESLTSSSTSSAAFQDKVTLSPTVNVDRAHLLFGCATHRRFINLTGQTEMRTIYDAQEITLSMYDPTSVSDYNFHFTCKRFYPRAAAPVIKLQHRSVPGTANSAISDAALCLIEYNDTPSVRLNGFTKLLGNARIR